LPVDRGDAPVTVSQAETVRTATRFSRLVFLFLAHAVGTANITLLVAMAPALERSLGVGHAEFGLMVAAYYSALLVWALPAGWLVDRFGIGPMLIAAHALLAAGTLTVAGAHGFAQAAAGLVLSGMGYALVNPSTARGVLLWFPERGRATAMGVKQTGVPAGGVAAALVVAAVGGDVWRDLAVAFALLTFTAGLGFTVLGIRRPAAESAIRLSDLRRLLGRPRLVYFNAAACLYAIGQSAFFAYLVLFLHDALKIEPSKASLCLALAHVASAAGRIAWGLTSDLFPREGRKITLVGCGTAAAAGVGVLAVLPGVGGVAMLVPVAMMLGLTLGGYAGLTQTTAVEIVEPRLAGASIGYNMLLTNAGTMLGPALFGATLDYGGYSPAWIATGTILAFGACLFLVGLRTDPRRVDAIHIGVADR